MKKERKTTHDYNLGHQEDTKMVTEPQIHPSKSGNRWKGTRMKTYSKNCLPLSNINNDVIDQLSLYIERKDEEEKGFIKKYGPLLEEMKEKLSKATANEIAEKPTGTRKAKGTSKGKKEEQPQGTDTRYIREK